LLPVGDPTLERLASSLLRKEEIPEETVLHECLRGDPSFCLWAFFWIHWHASRAQFAPLELVASPEDASDRPVETLSQLARLLRHAWPHWLKWDWGSPFLIEPEHGESLHDFLGESFSLIAAARREEESPSILAEKGELVAFLVGGERLFLWGMRRYHHWVASAFDLTSLPEPNEAIAKRMRPAVWKNWRKRKTGRRIAELLNQDDAADFSVRKVESLESVQRWAMPIHGEMVERFPDLADLRHRLHLLQEHHAVTLETEKMDALAEFAAGAGHEINNPLAIIGGYAQLLLDAETEPDRRRKLAIMAAQVRRAHEMIADIRLFARPPEPRFEEIELTEQMEKVLRTMRPEAREQSTELVLKGRRPAMTIPADPVQFQVAMTALIRNALEALGQKGTIEISWRRVAKNAVEIRIEDNGPGIPGEIRPLIFSPYFSGRQAGRGLGFGLSKVWQIVRMAGGSITVESEENVGTIFHLFLPIVLRKKQSES
jgi:hypothetical protein